MVQAFADESSLAPYKSRLGKVIRDRMVRFYAASSLTNPTTLKSYFRGPTRRFTWNQVLQAVGRLPASSPRLYEVACNSPEYAELEATMYTGQVTTTVATTTTATGQLTTTAPATATAPAPAKPRPAHVKATQPPTRRRPRVRRRP